MFGFGFSEIILTSALALIVVGPKRLPSVLKKVGGLLGGARRLSRELNEQLTREVDALDASVPAVPDLSSRRRVKPDDSSSL